MIDVIEKIYEKYHIDLIESLSKYEYRYYRYRLGYSLVFFYLPNEDDISSYVNLIRLTDSFIALEKYFYCIIYEGANAEQAAKATNNLLNRYKSEYKDSKAYISLRTPGKRKIDRTEVVESLFDLMKKTIKEDKHNTITTLDD